MSDICKYKTELVMWNSTGTNVLGAYYPEVNAVVTWSLDTPIELIEHFAMALAKSNGVRLDEAGNLHCPRGCPGGTVVLCDHVMDEDEFMRIRGLLFDQIEYCIGFNDQLVEIRMAMEENVGSGISCEST
jgi:hypothetical protein